MSFLATQLPSGRWGIFNKNQRLLFTVGSEETLEAILAQLSHRQIPVQVLTES